MKIGNIELKHGLFLAPMAGVTDRSFRRLCREKGAEYAVSEMISAKALVYEQMAKSKSAPHKTATLAALGLDEFPTAIQIFGSDPEYMAKAASMIETGEYKGFVSEILPAAIDINMGCPVHKIVSNGEGSALMRSPELVEKIICAVVKSVNIPVTVKIRAGWDSESINATEIARIAEASGAGAIFIHARTRQQMYGAGTDWRIIEAVKRAVKIAVIGNGDVFSGEDTVRMLRETGCDGVMIGRGAMGNPWIFEESIAAITGSCYKKPSIEEISKTALKNLDMMIAEKGERCAVSEARGLLTWYIKGIHGAASARAAIGRSTTADEIRAIFSSLVLPKQI